MESVRVDMTDTESYTPSGQTGQDGIAGQDDAGAECLLYQIHQ